MTGSNWSVEDYSAWRREQVKEAADQMGLPLLGTSMIHNLFRVLEADGRADEGTQALVKALEKLTGVTVEG